MLHSVSLLVNGSRHDLAVAGHESLLGVLRERLGLTGTKLVCDRGECGACTVLLDGRPAYACLTLAAACDGVAVTTVEGLAPDPDTLHPLQDAFVRHDAVQCGFCTPGQLVAGAALLARNADPTDAEIAEAMSGNLCRCGTYPKIVAAIRDAGSRMRAVAGGPVAARTDVG